jgi:hypothetical protein
MYIHPRFEDLQDKRVMVDCWPSRSPAFVKDGGTERFYIRAEASIAEPSMSQWVKASAPRRIAEPRRADRHYHFPYRPQRKSGASFRCAQANGMPSSSRQTVLSQ